jgi:hypothetical protein
MVKHFGGPSSIPARRQSHAHDGQTSRLPDERDQESNGAYPEPSLPDGPEHAATHDGGHFRDFDFTDYMSEEA